jgi:hypothetical protein
VTPGATLAGAAAVYLLGVVAASAIGVARYEEPLVVVWLAVTWPVATPVLLAIRLGAWFGRKVRP